MVDDGSEGKEEGESEMNKDLNINSIKSKRSSSVVGSRKNL